MDQRKERHIFRSQNSSIQSISSHCIRIGKAICCSKILFNDFHITRNASVEIRQIQIQLTIHYMCNSRFFKLLVWQFDVCVSICMYVCVCVYVALCDVDVGISPSEIDENVIMSPEMKWKNHFELRRLNAFVKHYQFILYPCTSTPLQSRRCGCVRLSEHGFFSSLQFNIQSSYV